MARDSWAAGVVVVCSGRTLVQNRQGKLDRDRRWWVGQFAGSLTGLGLVLYVMGWRGQFRLMRSPNYGRALDGLRPSPAEQMLGKLRHTWCAGGGAGAEQRTPVQNIWNLEP